MQTAKHVKMAADSTDNSATTPMAGMESVNRAAMASSMLAMVHPTTTVSVRASAYVAGRAAYELVLVPRSAASTVGELVLAIDAATGTLSMPVSWPRVKQPRRWNLDSRPSRLPHLRLPPLRSLRQQASR